MSNKNNYSIENIIYNDSVSMAGILLSLNEGRKPCLACCSCKIDPGKNASILYRFPDKIFKLFCHMDIVCVKKCLNETIPVACDIVQINLCGPEGVFVLFSNEKENILKINEEVLLNLERKIKDLVDG